MRFLAFAFLELAAVLLEDSCFGELILLLDNELPVLAEATWPRVISSSSSSEDALEGEVSFEQLTCEGGGGGEGGRTGSFGLGGATALNACSRLSSLDIFRQSTFL